MKFQHLLYFSLVLFLGCSNDSVELEYLKGYWEIKEVIMPNGANREYTVNNTIDFIELEADSTGFRKKLKPNLDGTFKTSDKHETIEIKLHKKGLYIHYSTPLMQWKEKIIKLNEQELEVENDRSIRYIYKRHQPFEKL